MKKHTRGEDDGPTVGSAAKMGVRAIATVAGVIAAGYLLYQKAKPHMKPAAEWVERARRKVAREAKDLGDISRDEYERMVEKALWHYGILSKVTASELRDALDDLKDEWKHIQKEAKRRKDDGEDEEDDEDGR